MSGARPKLHIALTTSDKVVEMLCWSGLAALWLAVFFLYSRLPDTIPLHFNLAGKVNRIGSKSNIWLEPAIATLLVIGLTILNRYPHTFNYLEEITSENAERNYKMATKLLRYLKLFIVILFGAILMITANTGKQNLTSGDSTLAVVAILVFVMLLPVAILIYITRRTAGANS